MVFTKHGFTGRLYEAQDQGSVWCGICVMGEAEVCGENVTLSDALTNQQMAASFLMLGQRPQFSSWEQEQNFTDRIARILRKKYAKRCILWAADEKESETGCLCILSADGTMLSQDLSF